MIYLMAGELDLYQNVYDAYAIVVICSRYAYVR